MGDIPRTKRVLDSYRVVKIHKCVIMTITDVKIFTANIYCIFKLKIQSFGCIALPELLVIDIFNRKSCGRTED